MNTLYAGLVVWLVTLLIVEAKISEPLRRWVAGTKTICVANHPSGVVPPPGPCLDRKTVDRHPKLVYLVNCHLCTGCWVALVVALLVPGPLPLVVLNAVLYKAVGHGVLEVTALLRRTNP